ncbi:hypothetical protein [Nostoc sp.]|uniref:hypothetical protein n=1 Tax=Nostoc sp. TaxID=1180 RepID=UPI002FF4F46F
MSITFAAENIVNQEKPFCFMIPNSIALTAWLDPSLYVHIKFANTNGGTDLGIRLDLEASNLQEADFEHQTGRVHLVWNLTLNYVKVQCVTDIELASLKGKGHLEPVES